MVGDRFCHWDGTPSLRLGLVAGRTLLVNCHETTGKRTRFLLYQIGFFILIISRLVHAFALAYADFGSWYAPNYLTNIVALLIFLPVGYTLFCVGKYFGFARASGADHFDPEYRTKPFVRKGIFKYIPNAMYALALLLFFVFAVATGSKAMLALAAFYYVFIWVHYFCTERPDMEVIYGGHLEQIRASKCALTTP